MPYTLVCGSRAQVVSHAAPTFPPCVCDVISNQADAYSPEGLCQKNAAHGERVCFARNYEGDKKIGSW
eukprot:6617153-Prymnesium_polylepis.1